MERKVIGMKVMEKKCLRLHRHDKELYMDPLMKK